MRIVKRAILGMFACMGAELVIALGVCKVLGLDYVLICPPLWGSVNEMFHGELNAGIALTVAVAVLGLILGALTGILGRKK